MVINIPTRKAHLALMAADLLRTFSEQDRGLAINIAEGHQDGGSATRLPVDVTWHSVEVFPQHVQVLCFEPLRHINIPLFAPTATDVIGMERLQQVLQRVLLASSQEGGSEMEGLLTIRDAGSAHDPSEQRPEQEL
eukprot:CAMPEP_0117773284 /NCGR_PEP_ID=MMETSP0947-20121206/25745_1 /TAXON_ID=44440 /ORGANISM="Chattonella subsalsa, Strain CCMP2191" /LENGTH=135 /DNA_ID=CAMNT_0005599359 /DNA_START=636 /DNA_END=1043 /DNA_ORIENTATION=+